MLKITTHRDTLSTTFQLEGRLAGPWVEELERCWASAASQPEKHPFCLDLSGVTYVDAVGKDLLKTIHQGGATLVASGCLMSCLVREITQAGQSRERTKCHQDNS
jgi:anti-anti-sigma regulatory factor